MSGRHIEAAASKSARAIVRVKASDVDQFNAADSIAAHERTISLEILQRLAGLAPEEAVVATVLCDAGLKYQSKRLRAAGHFRCCRLAAAFSSIDGPKPHKLGWLRAFGAPFERRGL